MVQETEQTQTGQEPDETTEETTDETVTGTGQEPATETGSDDTARLKAELEKVRKEAAKHRTEKKSEKEKAEEAQRQIQAISKALGITDDGASDPDALQQELQRAQGTAKRNAVEAVAVREAFKLDIRPDRLDALLKLADIDSVELADDGKPDTEAVSTMLSGLLEEYPEWKRQNGKNGSAGGSNPPRDDLSGLTKPYNEMTYEEQVNLYHENRSLWERARAAAGFGGND